MREPHRLLLADDHVLFRQGIQALLRDYPDLLVVGDASNGVEAFEKSRALGPDVVLIDADLPSSPSAQSSPSSGGYRDGLHGGVRDGLQATRRIRDELSETKVVLLTSSAERSDLVYEAIKAGALGFVTKTSEIGELVTAIRSVAKGQASITMGSLTSLVTILGNPNLGSQAKHDSLEEQLSGREEEVLDLVAQGHSNREIALALYISESTVRSHMHNILDKLQLGNRVQAATYALTSPRKGRATSTANRKPIATTTTATRELTLSEKSRSNGKPSTLCLIG